MVGRRRGDADASTAEITEIAGVITPSPKSIAAPIQPPHKQVAFGETPFRPRQDQGQQARIRLRVVSTADIQRT